MEQERRFIPLEGLEVRAAPDGEPRGIGGTAALFGSRTTIGGMFDEEIAPGAFDEALKTSDVRGLYNHNPDFVLGRTSAGTMELRATDKGLEYEIPELPKSRADVLEAIRRGDVTGNSFSFTVAEETWIEPDGRDDKSHLPLRIIQRVGMLADVGPVAFPAYEETKVSARSVERAAEIRKAPPVKVACSECAGLREQVAVLEERLAQTIMLRDRERQILE